MDIINNSSLPYNDLLTIVNAINKSIPQVCLAWKKPVFEISISRKSKRAHIILSDSVSSTYGYHTFLKGYAFGRVYLTKNLDYNSKIISHEVFEIIVNPRNESRNEFQLEVCDPVMQNSFDVDGIQISDWVYPSWFSNQGRMPFNFLNTLKNPFEVSEGGYILKTNMCSPT